MIFQKIFNWQEKTHMQFGFQIVLSLITVDFILLH